MGLLRGVARTAVVAGTATAVSNRVSRRQAGRWAAQDAGQAQEAPPAGAQQPVYAQPVDVQQAPAPAAAEPVDMSTKLAQLKDLGQLKEQGVLSDAEFEAEKSRILAQ
ncbi:SHOCT domain-containing protein [Cellulomonas sp. S1-8]|uniref:SHOCT domain-containing protein n=1 Tax=Cellulomonas sp. S1-8 TaxID=2904790 RepID=UPI00224382AA|nr:SHOCT domain-containing protein [Cellulomonas sp. S1-8]UZN03678.1 SHOCT domain-containing protein [Cellulomonas sp. S1-8]